MSAPDERKRWISCAGLRWARQRTPLLETATQGWVLWVIASHFGDDGVCHPSMATLSELTMLDERSVRRAVAQMIGLNLLKRDIQGGRRQAARYTAVGWGVELDTPVRGTQTTRKTRKGDSNDSDTRVPLTLRGTQTTRSGGLKRRVRGTQTTRKGDSGATPTVQEQNRGHSTENNGSLTGDDSALRNDLHSASIVHGANADRFAGDVCPPPKRAPDHPPMFALQGPADEPPDWDAPPPELADTEAWSYDAAGIDAPGYEDPTLDDPLPDTIPWANARPCAGPEGLPARFPLEPIPEKPKRRPAPAQAASAPAAAEAKLLPRQMVEIWNEIMRETPIALVHEISAKRDSRLRYVADKVCGNQAVFWRELCVHLGSDPWFRGERNSPGRYENFKGKLDTVLNGDFALEHMEELDKKKALAAENRKLASPECVWPRKIHNTMVDEALARDLGLTGDSERDVWMVSIWEGVQAANQLEADRQQRMEADRQQRMAGD